MEFKEAIKIRRRICDCYKGCDGCPLFKLADGCIDAMIKLRELNEYEKILEEWAKEHPVVTNAEKYIEVIKNVFGGAKLNKKQVRMCVKAIVGLNVDCNTTHCSECMKWWDEEYKEPEKEKKNEFFMWTIRRKCIDDIIRCNDERRKLRKETRR